MLQQTKMFNIYHTEFLTFDYKKAPDSAGREEIQKNLEKIKIVPEFLRKVRSTYKRTINCIKTNKGQSAWSEIRSGVR
jgi:hypothetical protein